MVRQALKTIGKYLATLVGLPLVGTAVLLARGGIRRGRPNIFWGTEALINIKYHSEAVKRKGYQSTTMVRRVFGIHGRHDFDCLMDEVVDKAPLVGWLPRAAKRLLRDYYVFAWAIARYDIFHFYFRDTILSPTPIAGLELRLLRWAGKKTVFMAYGSDVQIISRFRGLLFKHAQNADYPQYVRDEAEVLKRVNRYSAEASFIISGNDWVDYMPRWDLLLAGHFAIDTEEWCPVESKSPAPAIGRPVVVLHAPNHREIKGSRFLIEACEELKAEGLPIELQLVERVPNSRIRELMQHCDIVADQFIMGWYALFAIEGMSMGKPVMAYLRPDLVELYSLYSYAGSCPIVNSSPLRIKAALRELVLKPELRATLGSRGREYVQRHHSLEALGQTLESIYQRLWTS